MLLLLINEYINILIYLTVITNEMNNLIKLSLSLREILSRACEHALLKSVKMYYNVLDKIEQIKLHHSPGVSFYLFWHEAVCRHVSMLASCAVTSSVISLHLCVLSPQTVCL